MNAYEILRDVHHIGSPIVGTVISREDLVFSHGWPTGRLVLETESNYPAWLPYNYLADDKSTFSPDLIPELGALVRAVVFNFVDGKLYLSARPSDLRDEAIRQWQSYYDYIGSLRVGSEVTGVVHEVRPFGLFVDIGGPFLGLIDIGHTQFNGGVQLPPDDRDWPIVGDQICCNVAYFRLGNQQIGLGWVPTNAG